MSRDRVGEGSDKEETSGLAGALGANPFLAPPAAESDALDAWLGALDRLAASEPSRPPAQRLAPPPKSRDDGPASDALDVEAEADDASAPAAASAMLRLLDRETRARLEAFLDTLHGWDPFGLSGAAVARTFPIFHALYRHYFRVRSEGHANVPRTGAVVLASNHAGLLPFDGAMTAVDLLLHTEPPRLVRSIVERWAGTLPFVNVFYARVGQVIGTHENFARLLDDGAAVLVFPEGIAGVRKPVTQRYRVQHFHVGFVEHALRAEAPIVPMAVIGSDDQTPILYDVKPLARLLGLPVAPITPTFPWLGPLGLLPYPVRYRIVYGEPLRFHERFGPDAAAEPGVVRALANQVRKAVQHLIDKHRS
jgi:1-acyl-sn-glycerol-3-phosphate acyltransferase